MKIYFKINLSFEAKTRVVRFIYFPLKQPQIFELHDFCFFGRKGALPLAPPGFKRGLRWELGGVQRDFNK